MQNKNGYQEADGVATSFGPTGGERGARSPPAFFFGFAWKKDAIGKNAGQNNFYIQSDGILEPEEQVVAEVSPRQWGHLVFDAPEYTTTSHKKNMQKK